MKELIYQIGDLIEERCHHCEHGRKKHQEHCLGCNVYNELRMMGKKLDVISKRKRAHGYAEILSKGQDMTIRELRALIERYNVSKKYIRVALGMDSATFYSMLQNLGLSEPEKEMIEQ